MYSFTTCNIYVVVQLPFFLAYIGRVIFVVFLVALCSLPYLATPPLLASLRKLLRTYYFPCFVFYFSTVLVFFSLLLVFFLLGFAHWLGFLGGIWFSRFRLRVLKRMTKYGPGTYVR